MRRRSTPAMMISATVREKAGRAKRLTLVSVLCLRSFSTQCGVISVGKTRQTIFLRISLLFLWPVCCSPWRVFSMIDPEPAAGSASTEHTLATSRAAAREKNKQLLRTRFSMTRILSAGKASSGHNFNKWGDKTNPATGIFSRKGPAPLFAG